MPKNRHLHTLIGMHMHGQICSTVSHKSSIISWISGIINTDKDHETILEALYGVGDNCNTFSPKHKARMKVICWDISDGNFGQST